MPILKTAGSLHSGTRPHAATAADTWTSHAAQSVTHWGRSGAVISVEGELDASNVGDLADYVQRCAYYCDWLVLDLSMLEFIGTVGFSTLRTIADRCAEDRIYCTTVPGAAVARLLRICDPDNMLPTAPSRADALAGAQVFRPVR
ncbi:STAS domain-containing protein [Mycolicibacter arupensis]|jgi:anti-anti-sigma factor|uniref:STAS domain-containing protein n=1 Tax=Mycolicibacter arupensis TaxID=342002 RepID=UPI00122CC0B7|nr:STAS domain-containing protein [Mycolicibacter arupensis]KAA1433036.1 STAS domain-containing protein [Mycolicibacter arupensis]